MDPKTLYISNMAMGVFLGLALLFFRFKQKTYPGFGLWVASTFLAAAGYASSLLRLAEWEFLSIILANLFFTFTALLRLAGVVRFLKDRRLPWPLYVFLPLADMIAISYFSLAVDSFITRVFIFSLVVSSLAVSVAYVLLKHRMEGNVVLYRAMGWVCLLFSAIIMTRAMAVLFSRTSGIFAPQTGQQFYLLAIILIETAWAMGFLMMNSQRLEAELRASQDSLGHTVGKLEKSLAEIKTLSGLLPICAHCKKVRNDQGYWQQIEEYISEHSSADFSHGICPECARKLYPHLKLEKLK
jgi:hypothetical protein